MSDKPRLAIVALAELSADERELVAAYRSIDHERREDTLAFVSFCASQCTRKLLREPRRLVLAHSRAASTQP